MRKKTTGRLLALFLAAMMLLAACSPSQGGETEAPAEESAAVEEASPEASPEAEEAETAEPEAEEAAGLYSPGAYTASTMGNNGAITISVTFSEDRIEGIAIDESSETLGLGTAAIDKMSTEILENQSLGVDLVSGATYTSGAFLSAVMDCVTQAGGDANALRAEPITQAPATQETLTTDLVVVGGGSAGMTAASRAREAGLDVIVLEKMAYTGGAAMISGGTMVISGSQLQQEKGVTDDSPATMIADFQANGGNLNDVNLLTLYAENVGSTVDWAMDALNLKFVDEEVGYNAEYSINRTISLDGGAAGYTKTLRDALDASGATLMLETRADSLIVEDGVVVGVEATASNGSAYTIRATSVLLATGGYGYNQELLTPELQEVLYYGPVSSTGDGQIMAQAVDAKTELTEYGKSYPNGVEVATGIGKSTIYGNLATFSVSGILVNKSGERVVNERASNKDILTAQLAAEGKQLYLLMDAASYEAWSSNLARNSITQQDLDRWLGNEGGTPLLVSADSIEEAAAKAGLDPAALQATVDRYNGFVQSGTDEDFGRLADFMQAEIAAGPYYIVEQKPRFATTMGSLVTTDQLEVYNTSDEVIPGLYAAGEMVNGVHGDDSAPGANLGWALTSGRLAADAIVAAQ